MTVGNAWRDLLVGPGEYDTEDHALRNQEVYRLLSGMTGWGRRALLTEYEGTDAANVLTSSDPTNGIGMDASSQNSTYQIVIQNSGMNIYGAPTLEAFTQDSILFVGTSKVLSQDPAALVWKDSTNRMGIGTNAPGQTLHVVGNAQVSTFLGVGGAPDTTHALLVTGLAEVTSRMGIGAAADATITLLVTGTLKSTGDFTVGAAKFVVTATTGATAIAGDVTVNTNKVVITASTGATAIAGNITNDTTLLVTDVTNDKVSIGAATSATAAMAEVAGYLRVTSNAGAPSTGEGLSLAHDASGHASYVISYDSSAYLPVSVLALSVDLTSSGTSKLKVDATGIGVFAHATQAKQTITGVTTGTLAQLQAVVRQMLTAEAGFGWWTDSTT